jgi:adhesin/invasin
VKAVDTTDATGIANVTSWTLGANAGANSLTATSTGLTGSPLTFTATATAGSATQIAVNAGDGQSATVNSNVATAPSVIVKDQFGNPVSGVSVTFAVASGGGSITGAATTSNASGIATVGSWKLGTAAGTNTLTATSSGLTGSPVTFTATATAAAAKTIALNAGNGQSATVNTNVATAPAVFVSDTFGNPVAGVTVTFAVATGGGSVAGGTQPTNASGIATVGSWTLGTAIGSNTLTATAAGLSGSPVTFTATGTAGAATQLALSAGDGQTATVNTAVTTPPRVIARDQFSNPAPGAIVTFAVASGGGSLVKAIDTTDAAGIANVGSWTLGATAGSNTMTATATGLSGSPVTFTATGTAAGATQIALNAGDGQVGTVNQNVGTAPSVIVKDQFNNPVQGVSVTFAVASGGGSVTAATPTTNASGIATLGSWRLGTTAGTNTLTATSGSLTGSPVTFTATAVATAAKTIVLNAGNGQSATVNTNVATAPSVAVSDSFGNAVAGVTVTFAVATGGGSVAGGSQPTNGGGIATVGSWTLGTTAGSNTLTATSAGLTGSPVTFTATGTAGAATQLALNAGNGQTATVNTNVATAPSVIARDQFNNAAAGAIVTFAVASGGGSVVKAIDTTDATGIANVTSWKLGTTAGSNSLTATSGSLTGSPVTFTATGSADVANQIAVSAGDGQSALVNSDVAVPPTVIVKDQFGNPVAGTIVTFAVASGGGSLTKAVDTTDAAGLANVGSWTLGAVAGANTMTATATGLSGSPVTFTATGQASTATTIALLDGNSQTDTIGATLPAPYRVVVTDGTNPVSGVTVNWAVTVGGGSIPASSVTNASGIATATHTFGLTAGAQTATASVGGLTGSPVTFTSTANAGNAKTIALNGGNTQTDTIGATLPTAYTVLVTDRGGNPVNGITVTWAAGGGVGTITPSSNTNASGIATATRMLGNPLGSQTATATAGGLTGSPVNFTATATHGNAKTIALNGGDAQTDTVGKTLPVAYTVLVTDRLGNPVPSITVTWAVVTGGGSITPSSITNGSGIAAATRVLGGATGSQTATATVAGLTGSPVTFTATALGGSATTIALFSGNGQTDTIGAMLGTPYAVKVTDGSNNPVSGVAVTWAVTGGGGSILPLSSFTNGVGIATATHTFGTTAGAQTASADVSGLTGSPVTFTSTASAGNAKTIALAGGDAQTDTIGATLPTAYTVLITDRGANPVNNVTVTWAAIGGGSITPSSNTNASGIATAARVLGTTAGSQTATATASGLTGSPVNFTATATHGNAKTIALNGGDAQTDTVGKTLAVPYSVLVTDRAANPVPSVTVTWAAGGGGSITPSSITNGSGIAAATRVLGNTAGTQTATATVGGLTGSPVTFTATAVNAAASAIALFAGNGQTDTIGAALATAYQVKVTDASNNPVAGITVTWAVTGGGGSIPASSITNGSGIASATHTLGTTAGTQTATADVTGLAGTPVTFTSTATHGNATTIALDGGNAQTDTIGATLAAAYTVLVTDRGANPVNNVSVTWAAGGGGSITPSSNTNASGIASATRVLGTTAGTQTATATVGGLIGSPVNFTATASHGNATTIALNGGDSQTDTIGATLPLPYTVLVTDRAANPVNNITVTWAAGGGGSITPSSNTNASGIAAATRVLGTTAGTQTATATVGGLIGSPVNFTATATAGGAATIALNGGDAQTDTIGATVAPLSVIVKDAGNNPVNNVTVTWNVTSANGSITPTSNTNAGGIASASLTFGDVSGALTATASVSGLAGSPVGFAATITHGHETTIALAGGNTQTDTIDAVLATPYSVAVTDRGGNPVAGVSVTWAATSGGGSITSPSITNGSGIATATRTLGSAIGTDSATATAGGLTGSPVGFAATAVHGNAASIVVNGGDAQTDTIGATLATYTVLVKDRANNVADNVTVNWTAGGGGSITASSFTNGSGIAAATRVLGTTAGTQTAQASTAGVVATADFTATATHGAAKTIALNGGNSQTDTVAATLGTAYTVLVTDRGGNAVNNVTVTWAASVGSITASSLTNGSGIASATRTLGTSAGTQTATATVAGLTGSPVNFSATANAANAKNIAANSSTTLSGTVNTLVSPTPSVVVTDQFGNAKSGITVTFAVGIGGGSATAPTTPATNALGVATVGGWTLGTTAGTSNNTMTASAGGLTGSPVTFTASAAAGAVSVTNSLVSATSPITASTGSSLSTVTITVRDAFSNPISGKSVTLAVSGSGNTVNQPASATNASGQTTGSFRSTVAETKTVTASVTGTGALSQQPSVVVNPDVVSLSVSTNTSSAGSITACSVSCTTGGGTAALITVTVKDQFGNVISGKTVTPSSTGTSNTFNPTTGTTNGSGVFTSTFNSTKAEGKTISAAVTGSGTLTATAGVTVNAAAAASIAVNGGSGQFARIGTAVATAPSAIVRDAFSNPKSGVTVTFSVSAGGGSLTSATPVTNASGIATVGSWTLGGTGSENPQGGSNPGTTNNTLGATASGAGSTSFSGFGFYILSSDVQPIFTASCALSGCHLASVHPFLSSSGTSFSETVGVVASCDGAKFRINPSFASTSVLYLRVSTTTECSGAMPPSASVTMTAANQQKIRMWINRGAANN